MLPLFAPVLPMKFEITDDMIEMLQGYLSYFVRFFQLNFAVGKWILFAGVALAVLALLSHSARVRNFFRKRRVR